MGWVCFRKMSSRIIPPSGLTTFEWTHRVVRSDAKLVRVHRKIHFGRVVVLGPAVLHRDCHSEAFREKLYLLSYGTLIPLAIFLYMW